jgi:hypothetical protein
MMDENFHKRDAKPCEIFPVPTGRCLKSMYSQLGRRYCLVTTARNVVVVEKFVNCFRH